MKFSTKLTLSITLILFVVLTVAGLILVKYQFEHNLTKVSLQHSKSHINQRILFQEKIANVNITHGLTNQQILNISQEVDFISGVSVYYDGNELYTSLQLKSKNLIEKLIKSGDNRTYEKIHNKEVLLITSPIYVDDKELYLSNIYDISHVYSQRKSSLSFFIKLNIVVIVLSAICIGIFSRFITKPLKQLTIASKKISNGNYEDRVEIYSKDEIGSLAKSFNIMANNIELKIIELRQSSKAKDEFVQNFTHELKTPLTSIIGYSDILRSEQTEPQVYVKAANYIFNEGKRLNTLAMKLLDLMNLEIDIKPIKVSNLNLNVKHQDLVDATILADKVLIECVISNLYANAINSGANRIEIIGEVFKNSYRITVRDNGCGISQEHINHLTKAFYMVDKSRSSNGSGLGLTLCSRILKMHNSKLIIKSILGKQTTMSFILPLN